MAEVSKITGAKLYLDAKRLLPAAPLPPTPPAPEQAEEYAAQQASPVYERRKLDDRRQANARDGRPPFDTRQKKERRKSRKLDLEA